MFGMSTFALIRLAVIACLIAAIGGYITYLRHEVHSAEMRLEDAQKTIGRLEQSNANLATGIRAQNKSLDDWLAQASTLADKQRLLYNQAIQHAQQLGLRAVEIMRTPPPADPAQDCTAIRDLLSNEIKRRHP